MCNERLEWLGDAALDWLVTRNYWHGLPFLSPASLTEHRQMTVNNDNFARVAVLLGMHRVLRIDSPFLQLDILSFADRVLQPEKQKPSRTNDHCKNAAPKALGDLLEAVAGAVLIDCKFNDKIFVSVFGPFFEPTGQSPLAGDQLSYYNFLSITEPKNQGNDAGPVPSSTDNNPIRSVLHILGSLGVKRDVIEYMYEDVQSSGEDIGNNPSGPSMQTKCSLLVKNKAIALYVADTRAAAKREVSRLALEWIRSGDNWKQFI